MKYLFQKHHENIYSCKVASDTYRIPLEGVFNLRSEDGNDWIGIVSDIEVVLSTPSGENIYNEDGSLSSGRYNIEQDNRETSYYLRKCFKTPTTYLT